MAPQRLGHKALAVNLWDLAACGAEPLAFTLALALPRADEAFLAGLCARPAGAGRAHGIELVGGDTTAGPLNICITVIGQVPAGQALLRSGARAGDDVWVSGRWATRALALEVFRGTRRAAGRRLRESAPRDGAARAARGAGPARCAAWPAAPSTSDGLLGDLGHVLRAPASAPRWMSMPAAQRRAGALPPAVQRECLLPGGDDYELLFTAAPAAPRRGAGRGARRRRPVSRIGRIEAGHGLRGPTAAASRSSRALAASTTSG